MNAHIHSIEALHAGAPIRSEFYHLRRTAIKDVAAYLGFLAGFIGAAPFAWGLLASQLASGTFVQGLWYFFGIVLAAGIFSGVAGLGIGYTAGVVWEQVHRHRRTESLKRTTSPKANSPLARQVAEPHHVAEHQKTPRLHIVGNSFNPLPDLASRPHSRNWRRQS